MVHHHHGQASRLTNEIPSYSVGGGMSIPKMAGIPLPTINSPKE